MRLIFGSYYACEYGVLYSVICDRCDHSSSRLLPYIGIPLYYHPIILSRGEILTVLHLGIVTALLEAQARSSAGYPPAILLHINDTKVSLKDGERCILDSVRMTNQC